MLFIAIQLWCLVTVWGLVTPGPPCPVYKAADNFDYIKFTDGTYYEVGRYVEKSMEKKNGDCVIGTLKSSKAYATLDVNFVENHHKSKTSWHLTYEPTKKQIIYTSYKNGKEDVRFASVALSTDNDKYYILYGCDYDVSKKSRIEEFWILTTTKKYDEATKLKIDKFLNSTDVIDRSKILWDHESCQIDN